ncbi:MAG: hypothetical protein Q9195_005144 [Heterodermia aff. obscurata]
MEPMLAELNAAQHTAVTSPASVIQILAPPGSGKTKTLTSRVAYLLSHHHYKPSNILCLTFTIKSSREMKERIAKLIGNGMEAKLILGTFHSVCRTYLARYGHLIGIPTGFAIADSSDSLSIIKRIVKRYNLPIDPKKAQSRISRSKSKGLTYEDIEKLEAQKNSVDQQDFVRVFDAYQDHLGQSNLLDFDDLLLRCVDLLRQHPACVSNIEVVLIDEFQDTNIVQFELMQLFATKNKRITTVGDPDQSIYGWRSAEVGNLKRMQKQYSDTLVIYLEDNYRSSAAILLAAREVIEQDESRIERPLLPTHCPGTVPVLRRLPTADIEGLWIVSEIDRAIAHTGNLLEHSDFAILLRSAALSRQLEAALGKAGIPYRMVGGQRFFDRFEIKVLLDYLRVISQPDHNDALARIINVPPRGIGPATVKTLLESAETAHRTLSLWQLIRKLVRGDGGAGIKISKSAMQGLATLVRTVLTAVSKLTNSTTPQPPKELMLYIIKKLNFEDFLKKTYEQDYDTRWANVEELLAQAADYPAQTGNDSNILEDSVLPVIEDVQQGFGNAAEEALSRFLSNVALATEIQRDDENNETGSTRQARVTVSTIHSAKGLEWPVVFIPSAYEGSIPHSRAEDTNEERRLFVVTSAEDDHWPLDGTENPQEAERRWNRSSTLNDDWDQQLPSKRRRMLSPTDNRSNPTIRALSATLESPMISTTTTTMQNSSSFSYVAHGGFTTAASQLQVIEAEAARSTKAANSSFKTKNSNKHASTKLSAGQSSLATYFGKPSIPDISTAAIVRVPQTMSHPSNCIAHTSTRISEPPESNLNIITNEIALPTPRKPLQNIPQDLSTHRLSNLPMPRPNSRPLDLDDDPYSFPRKNYPFFSSSPPKPPSPTSPTKDRFELDIADSASVRENATRPASTFHTTSVQQVGVRRTLGLKRSMNGWAAKGGFEVPRRVG